MLQFKRELSNHKLPNESSRLLSRKTKTNKPVWFKSYLEMDLC